MDFWLWRKCRVRIDFCKETLRVRIFWASSRQWISYAELSTASLLITVLDKTCQQRRGRISIYYLNWEEDQLLSRGLWRDSGGWRSAKDECGHKLKTGKRFINERAGGLKQNKLLLCSRMAYVMWILKYIFVMVMKYFLCYFIKPKTSFYEIFFKMSNRNVIWTIWVHRKMPIFLFLPHTE